MKITELPKTEVLTKKDFLDNMIAYYSEDPAHRRATNGEGACSYHRDDGNRCAVGRWIPDEMYTSGMEGVSVGDHFVFSRLPEKLKNLGEDFLTDIQGLHDGDRFWNSNGLSPAGEKRVASIRRDHNC